MTIDDALMQHVADLADPVIDVDFSAAQAQRRFAAHRDEMFTLSTVETPVFDIADFLRISAPEHLLHQASIVARIVARVDALEPVPVFGKDLFKDAPRWRGFCHPQAASLQGVGLCVVALVSHVTPTKAIPSSTRTEIRFPTSLALEPQGRKGNPQMKISIRSSRFAKPSN